MSEDADENLLGYLKRERYKSCRNKKVRSAMDNVLHSDKEKSNLCVPSTPEKQPLRGKISFKDISSDIFKEIAEIKKKNDRLKERANYIRYVVLFILTLTYVGILLYHGQICYSKYMIKETMVRERIQPTEDSNEDSQTPFMALTVCPEYHEAYKEEVLKEYGLTKKDYRKKGHYIPYDEMKSNKTWNQTGTEIFNSVTHDVREILRKLVVRTKNANTTRYTIDFDEDDISQHVDIVTKYWPSFGRCFNIAPKKNVVKQGITRIEALARISIYIYLGYPGQFMHSNSKTKVHTRVGQRVFIDIMNEISIYSSEQIEQYSCNPDINNKYDQSFYDIIANDNEKKFNCTVPFHPPTLSKTSGNMIEICPDMYRGENALSNYKRFVQTGPSSPFMRPCSGMDVFLGLPDIDTGPEDEAYIRLYLKTDIKIKSIILYYDSNTLFAEIGGYLGMLLGFSLLDFTSIVNGALFKMFVRKFQMKYDITNRK